MSGETEKQVSGWTVDTLHEHMETRISDLSAHLDERYETQTKALEAAFAAAERAVQAALLAAEKAVTKAELAAERRFEAVNEFRAQLSDQALTFMPRSESEVRMNAMSDKIDTLTGSRREGIDKAWGYLIGAVGVAAAIVALLAR